MRAWVFRNRRRLEALYGRPAPLPAARVAREPAHGPRVVELVPVRRASGSAR